MNTLRWSVLALAAALYAGPTFTQPDKYGNRKPACGCYVCGTPLSVSFNEQDCAGILAEDACGQSLGNLPKDKRDGFCQKLKAQFGAASLKDACRAYAPYCGPETTTASAPASGGGGTGPVPTGKSPGNKGPEPQAGTQPKSGKGDPAPPREVPLVAGSPGAPGAASAKAIPLPLLSLKVDPRVIVGGSRAQGTVELAQAPGPGGLTVTLDSNKPQFVAMPSTVTIAYGTASAETGPSYKATFPIDTKPVLEDTNIRIQAHAGAQTLQALLNVRMPKVERISLHAPEKCDSDHKATVEYRLIGPAPSGLKVRVSAYLKYPSGYHSGTRDEADTVPAGNSAGSLRIRLPTCNAEHYQRCTIHLTAWAQGQTASHVSMGGSCAPP